MRTLPALSLRSLSSGPVECIAIGASTGGIHALSGLLRNLPESVDAPILITQHLPPTFMRFFAAQVAELSGRPCEVAHSGVRLRKSHILVAPGQGHLLVERRGVSARISIGHDRAVSGCTPSVDPMFASAADHFGPSLVGVVLSGMGKDGLLGADRLAEVGADLFAQNRDSSVVWGMPGAVALAGLASAVLPPLQIADMIARRVRAVR